MALLNRSGVCCLSSKYDFNCGDSDDFLQLKSLSVFSELSVVCTSFTESFYSCNTHLMDLLKTKYRLRLKNKQCGVTELYSCHNQTKTPTADRHVSEELHRNIFLKSGIFIPLGTAICRKCRDNLGGSKEPKVKTSLEKEPPECLMKELTVNTDEEYKCRVKRRKIQKNDEEYIFGSQSTLCDTSSQCSVENLTKADSLNVYLQLDNISPVKKMEKEFSESSIRTQNRYALKAEQCVKSVFQTICAGDTDRLMEKVLFRLSNSALSKESEEKQIMKSIYLHAETECSWQIKRQILSIITKDMSLLEAQTFLPGMTKWRYYESKKHASVTGMGFPVVDTQRKRERVDPTKLEHFIEFITSTHVLKDLPFGQKTMRLEMGELIRIPNVIRSMTATSLINQYRHVCADEGVVSLGNSTMYKVLTECTASVRQSIEGLDNYVMEGSRSFHDLEKHLVILQCDNLRKKLFDSKHYLKTDFKVHLSSTCDVKDHCISYALCDVNNNAFSTECDHPHTYRCQSCANLDSVLVEVLKETESRQWENKDSVMFMVEKAVQDIRQLQKHIVRSKNQDKARASKIKNLEDGEAVITADWAMKFLPKEFREGQMDWFAKRGINWHISVALVKQRSSLQTVPILHIFQGQTQQDAETTTAVLLDVVTLLKGITKITKVHFMSDNAGCYKSSTTLACLRYHLPELASYTFSEAQNGKGPCDRKAAHAKGVIRRYLNEGHDITTAEEMKHALDTVPGSKYYVKVVDTIQDIDHTKTKHLVANISNIYNFGFEKEGLRTWQAYNIGQGKLLPWRDVNPSKISVSLKIYRDCATAIRVETEQGKTASVRQQWFCTQDGCVREFASRKHLEDHLLSDTCELQLEKCSLHDQAKVSYASKLENCSSVCDTDFNNIICDLTEHAMELCQGWALKERKKKTVFNEKQKFFMKEKFKIGKGGSKVDPYMAAAEMRQNKNFEKSEYLTGQQICSYFSRLSMQSKNMDMLDYVALKEEECKNKIREDILEALQI